MDIPAVLALYDEVRANPRDRPGLTVERVAGVVRLTGDFNFICAWDPDPATARAAVNNHAAEFKARGERLMWRVYEHDQPQSIGAWLDASGFKASPPGTLMAFDLADHLPEPRGHDIRRITTAAQVDDFLTAVRLAFGDSDPSPRRDSLIAQLGDGATERYVAYAAGTPVAAALMQVRGPFGQMFAGGVAPEHRGQGLYHALVCARADDARRRGLRYLITEARDTSEPILRRLGYQPAGREITWILDPHKN